MYMYLEHMIRTSITCAQRPVIMICRLRIHVITCKMIVRVFFACFVRINRDILDKDEKFDIPKAADSHITTSVFDNEVVK